jgi:hypothetical protein
VRSFLGALHRFWFTPETPVTLPLLRIVVGAYSLIALLPGDLARVRREAARPAVLVEIPPTLDALPIPFPMPAELWPTFAVVMVVAGVLATVGLLTRPALLTYAIGYTYLGAAFSAWGRYPHGRLLTTQLFAVLAFAPGATAWSVDRLLLLLARRRRGGAVSLPGALTGPPVPRWGTQLVLVLITLVMFSAGVSKLRHSGVRWADGETLHFYLTGQTIRIPDPDGPGIIQPERVRRYGFSQIVGPPVVAPEVAWRDGFGLDAYLYWVSPLDMGWLIGGWPWATALLSAMTLLFELTTPLLLVNRWLRNLYLAGACGMLAGIHFTMGIGFWAWMVVFVCAVDWQWIADRLRDALDRARVGRVWAGGLVFHGPPPRQPRRPELR